MRKYVDVMGHVSPSAKSVTKAADIVAALAPPKQDLPKALAKKEPPKPSAGQLVSSLLPGVAGGAAGAYLWKKHRVLGFLAGHAVGSTAYPIYRGRGDERKRALYQLGVEGAGVAGALYYKKHPVVGWLGGVVAGSLVSALMPDSPLREMYARRFGK